MHPAVLSIQTLGATTIRVDAEPVTVAGRKHLALLILLAMQAGRRVERAELASLLWPDLPTESARLNLRHAYFHLRRALESHGAADRLESGREWLAATADSRLRVDALDFAVAPPSCPITWESERCRPCVARLEQLAALYRGEFMPGFFLPDCTEFEDWLRGRRDAAHLHALALIERLSTCLELAGEPGRALPHARRFAELEPLNEEAHRRVMRLLAQSGQRGPALTQYENCRSILAEELGIEPDEATRALAASIADTGLAPTDATPPPVAGESSRRQVTIVDCELAPAGNDDPEIVLALLDRLRGRCRETLARYGGHVLPTLGGGLTAYFGYPAAIEHGTRRAVEAALAALRTVGHGGGLRIGIHADTIVAGSDPRLPDPAGCATRTAQQVRQCAEMGTLTISRAAWERVANRFRCVPLEPRPLHGLDESVSAWRIDQPADADMRSALVENQPPLVGRQAELATLAALWADVLDGGGRRALLRGEAGIGKSRLAQALRMHLGSTPRTDITLRFAPEFTHTPLHPVIAAINHALDPQDRLPPRQRFWKLVAALRPRLPATDDTAIPLLARLLSLPIVPPYREAALTPELQRDRTLTVLLDLLRVAANAKPCLLLIEDLHWADPTSRELLARLVRDTRAAPLMLLATTRPGFQPPWATDAVRVFDLAPLANEDTAILVRNLAGALPADRVARIVERSDGVPLFAEELARGLDRMADRLPDSLHDVLAARVDELGPLRPIAQLAATVGREFDVGLLARAASLDELALIQSLDALVDAGIVRPAGGSRYRFRHALIRDAAYRSQTRETLRRSHRLAAEAWLAESTERLACAPEILARHLSRGGEQRRAISYWAQAGREAGDRSALAEATSHYGEGLALATHLPDGVDKTRLEIELQVGLGSALIGLEGYGSRAAGHAFERAQALCADGADNGDGFRILWGLWGSASSRDGFPAARALAEKMLRIASAGGDPLQRQQAHYALGNVLFWQGEFEAARTHCAQAMALYEDDHHAGHVAHYGENAYVTSGSHLALAEWFLGYPERARRTSERVLAVARDRRHPFSLAYARSLAAILYRWKRQTSDAFGHADHALNLGLNHGFGIWQATGSLVRGCSRVAQGDRHGLSEAVASLDAVRRAMGGVATAFLASISEAHWHLRDIEAARRSIGEGLAVGRRHGDRHAEADLLRLDGVCLAAAGDERGAEERFGAALELSRRQGARAIELRAAKGMAHLRRKQGRAVQARHVLEDAYNGFTEGFATPDLLGARALLETL